MNYMSMLLRDSGSNRQHAIASVTYRSEAIQPPSPGALVELLKSARLRNQAAGITGMLMYEDGRFFQTLEGPPDHCKKFGVLSSRTLGTALSRYWVSGSYLRECSPNGTCSSFPERTTGGSRLGMLGRLK